MQFLVLFHTFLPHQRPHYPLKLIRQIRISFPFTGIAEVKNTLVEQHFREPSLYAFAKKMYLVFRHVHTIGYDRYHPF